MRDSNGIAVIVIALLCAVLLGGTAFTGLFQQAAHAQAHGFDALAHDLSGDRPSTNAPRHDNRLVKKDVR